MTLQDLLVGAASFSETVDPSSLAFSFFFFLLDIIENKIKQVP